MSPSGMVEIPPFRRSEVRAEHELEIISGKGSTRPRARLSGISTQPGCAPNHAMAQGDQLTGAVIGISASAQEILGTTWARGYLAVSSAPTSWLKNTSKNKRVNWSLMIVDFQSPAVGEIKQLEAEGFKGK